MSRVATGPALGFSSGPSKQSVDPWRFNETADEEAAFLDRCLASVEDARAMQKPTADDALGGVAGEAGKGGAEAAPISGYTMGSMVNQPHLDLASLDVVLQRVRRSPRDRALRLRAAQDVAILADYAAPLGVDNGDKLLVEAVATAKLLRRALDRANKDEFPSTNDVAAFTAWINGLHALLLKAIERPS